MSMISKTLIATFAFLGLAVPALRAEQVPPPVPPGPAPAATAPGPKIKFETPTYDFGKIKSGEVVKYSYIFTNTGDAVLEVTHVQPSCGCTTAGEWTKQVEPGKTGTIPVQFNSQNFNGQVYKTVTVNCNDKSQSTVVLQLKGTIWKPIEVIPQYAVLTIPPDAPTASTVVRILNNVEEPMEILSLPESNHKQFEGTLVTNVPGKEYQLTISTVPPIVSGAVQGQISFKTSSTNAPTVNVPFYANVQPAVVVSPNQIILPTAPLATKTTPKVTVQTTSTNALVISEPAVSDPAVTFDIKTVQPGKVYDINFTFPEGFELKPAQQITFTARTSHPQMPTLRVPILQMPRPAQLTPPPPAPAAAVPPPPPAQPASTH